MQRGNAGVEPCHSAADEGGNIRRALGCDATRRIVMATALGVMWPGSPERSEARS